GLAGTVITARADLADGTASATVHLRRRAVVVLSASFDPGWSVTVDGRGVATQMISPALVGVAVPAGVHQLTFRYAGFAGYPELLALAVLALAVSAWLSLRRRGGWYLLRICVSSDSGPR
ncbi:MAG TPA: YfhO family protein, partial [Streptosporangiaceae bacterium]|nr:YfhO family protein [Streptosporangiaceae bacterium]